MKLDKIILIVCGAIGAVLEMFKGAKKQSRDLQDTLRVLGDLDKAFGHHWEDFPTLHPPVAEFGMQIAGSMSAWPALTHIIVVKHQDHWNSICQCIFGVLKCEGLVSKRAGYNNSTWTTPEGKDSVLMVLNEDQEIPPRGHSACAVFVWTDSYFSFDDEYRATGKQTREYPEWRKKPKTHDDMMKNPEYREAFEKARGEEPPCLECGAMTIEEAGVMCICSGDKDHCHGCDLWPDN